MTLDPNTFDTEFIYDLAAPVTEGDVELDDLGEYLTGIIGRLRITKAACGLIAELHEFHQEKDRKKQWDELSDVLFWTIELEAALGFEAFELYDDSRLTQFSLERAATIADAAEKYCRLDAIRSLHKRADDGDILMVHILDLYAYVSTIGPKVTGIPTNDPKQVVGALLLHLKDKLTKRHS